MDLLVTFGWGGHKTGVGLDCHKCANTMVLFVNTTQSDGPSINVFTQPIQIRLVNLDETEQTEDS